MITVLEQPGTQPIRSPVISREPWTQSAPLSTASTSTSTAYA